jgi:hypothetical protein
MSVLVDPYRCAVRHVGSSLVYVTPASLPDRAPTIHGRHNIRLSRGC